MQRTSVRRVVWVLVWLLGMTAMQAGAADGSSQPQLPSKLQHVVFTGGDGSSCEKAIVIQHAANNLEGVAAEKAWISWKYPKAKLKNQGLSGIDNKTFDRLEIETADGASKTICFDITDFFGQW